MSNIILLDVSDDIPQMEWFGEHHAESALVPRAEADAQEEEMERDSLLEEGDPDVRHMGHHVEPKPMSPETVEATTHEVEVMEAVSYTHLTLPTILRV